MTRIIMLAVAFLLTANLSAQDTNLSNYSYVVIPEQFDFLKSKDEYKLNSMTQFYFEKNGFNSFLAGETPNADRCDGLYADVEELKTVFGTKLQIVLKDCNNNEVYRGQEGKSKYKEYDKTYQDALRKAFNSIETLRVEQKDVVLYTKDKSENASKEVKQISEKQEIKMPKDDSNAENTLPDAKFSNYSNSGKTYLLRKTGEGYSLYEESSKAADGLLLKGKIIVMEKAVKYMDADGKVSDASFDASGNLSIKDGATVTVYQAVN